MFCIEKKECSLNFLKKTYDIYFMNNYINKRYEVQNEIYLEILKIFEFNFIGLKYEIYLKDITKSIIHILLKININIEIINNICIEICKKYKLKYNTIFMKDTAKLMTVFNCGFKEDIIKKEIMLIKESFVDNIIKIDNECEKKINLITYNKTNQVIVFYINISLYENILKSSCEFLNQNMYKKTLLHIKHDNNITLNFTEFIYICKNCKYFHDTFYDTNIECKFSCFYCNNSKKHLICEFEKNGCKKCQIYKDKQYHDNNIKNCYYIKKNIFKNFIKKNRDMSLKKKLDFEISDSE